MRRKGKSNIFSNSTIRKKYNKKGEYEKSNKSYHYCMTCCCHGCRGDGCVKPRSDKSIKKNKFYQYKYERKHKLFMEE